MNAYELASWMENAIISDDWGELAKYYGWCNQNIPTMLRQQADKIIKLNEECNNLAKTINSMTEELIRLQNERLRPK